MQKLPVQISNKLKVSKSIDTWNWYRNRVSKSIDTQISFRYLIFLLLNLWLEVWKFIFMLHWAFLIDFDSKIIFCQSKIACTKLKKFEDIEKYRSWYQYLEIGIETRYRKVSILLNGYRGLVSIPEFGIETRYRKVLIPEKSINTQHYILLTVSSTSSVQLKPFL